MLTPLAEFGPASHHDPPLSEIGRHLPARELMLKAGEKVEGPLARWRRNPPYPLEGLLNEPHPPLIFRLHGFDTILRARERGYTGLLSGGVDTDNQGFVEFHQVPDYLRISNEIPHPPARHGIGLRETVQQYGPFLHLIDLADGEMPDIPVEEALIHLIDDQEQVMFQGQIGKSRFSTASRSR